MLPRLLFGIEQGTEGGLDGRRSEVRIVTGNQTIARLQFNGAAEVLMGGGKIAGERSDSSQPKSRSFLASRGAASQEKSGVEARPARPNDRSEEHTSELQSLRHLV